MPDEKEKDKMSWEKGKEHTVVYTDDVVHHHISVTDMDGSIEVALSGPRDDWKAIMDEVERIYAKVEEKRRRVNGPK